MYLAAQVIEASFSNAPGRWRLSSEGAAGGDGASSEAYAGIILADVMTVSKSAVRHILLFLLNCERSCRCCLLSKGRDALLMGEVTAHPCRVPQTLAT